MYILICNSTPPNQNFWLRPCMGTVHEPPNSAKRRFLGKFGSHGTIHTFKNYFAIVFPTISFQFSANKRYPNTPLMVGVQNYYFD